jgi:hypothetical protein
MRISKCAFFQNMTVLLRKRIRRISNFTHIDESVEARQACVHNFPRHICSNKIEGERTGDERKIEKREKARRMRINKTRGERKTVIYNC